jgi:hypothetical protein
MAERSACNLVDMDRDSIPPIREGWVLREDRLVSRVMLHRYARLYADRLELFHTKDKDSPELEYVLPVKGMSISGVNLTEADVKPKGTNLLIGYMSGDIKTQSMVRPDDCAP